MTTTKWQYLESRPDNWKKQLYIKGKRIKANVIYSDLLVNKMSLEEAAENWDLPLSVIAEVIEYCESNQELLKEESLKGRISLEQKGVAIDPPIINR
jgi:uncharacterized protein (DUF433 family)